MLYIQNQHCNVNEVPLFQSMRFQSKHGRAEGDTQWRILGGGPLGHGSPLWKNNFFIKEKIGKLGLVLAPFVWALVASKNLAPLLKS